MARRWLVAVFLCVLAASVQAQELRCNQVFMNPSEKAVCASPELLAIDAQMARAYQEAKPHLKGLRKDQRAFKRERKACKGDMTCLLAVYEAQIAELRSAVPAPESPPPLDEAFEAPQPDPALTGVVAEVAAQPLPNEPARAPVEVPASAPLVTEEAAAQPQHESSWVLVGLFWFAVIAIVVGFINWLFKAVGRCPECTKWFAAEELDRQEQVGTEYETVTRIDERRNRSGNLIDTVKRKEQVAHSVVRAAIKLKCQHCGHRWTQHDKRRL